MRLRNKNYEIDMLNGPVMPKLLSFALPLWPRWARRGR